MYEIPFENRLIAREQIDEQRLVHQYWRELLFLHWKCDPAEIQKTLPPGLTVDTFKGDAYVSLVPFFMEEVRIARLPAIPMLTNFIEINVRTYVYDKDGIPGVWFYSLDLDNWIGARMARMTFSLPYFFSKMHGVRSDKGVEIHGTRVDNPKASIQFSYQPVDEKPRKAELESLDFFLVERYFLFSYGSNKLYKGRVHHQPYLITDVNVTKWSNDLLELNSFNRSNDQAALVHYSHEVSVDIFKLKKV